jgi:hypothetical protein
LNPVEDDSGGDLFQPDGQGGEVIEESADLSSRNTPPSFPHKQSVQHFMRPEGWSQSGVAGRE